MGSIDNPEFIVPDDHGLCAAGISDRRSERFFFYPNGDESFCIVPLRPASELTIGAVMARQKNADALKK